MQPRALPTEPDAAVVRVAGSPTPSPAADALRLVARLGTGATAVVWQAVDVRGRTFALKIPRPDLCDGVQARELLQREHATLAAIRHPHVVKSFGVCTHAGAPALLLEHVEGGDLVALAGGPPRTWLRAARELLAALRRVHDCGFVHRDVKARNVLLDADDRVRLVDFASALPIGARAPRGGTTAAHLPPQAAQCAASADDAYAFAVLLHELLTGRLPAAEPAARVLPVAADAAVRDLCDRVSEALATRGRSGVGLLAFVDVIESAIAAHP